MDLDIPVGMLPVVGEYSFPMDEVLPTELLSRARDGVAIDLPRVEGVVGLLELLMDPPERARARMTDEFLDDCLQNADVLRHGP